MYNSQSPDVFHEFKELHEKKGRCVYLLHDENVGAFTATTYKMDMEKYLIHEDCPFNVDDSLEEVKLFYGIVLNSLELPFNIDNSITKDKLFYVLTSEGENRINVEEAETLDDVIQTIEFNMKCDENLEIEDFIVIFGEEIGLGLTVARTGSAIRDSDVYN